MNSVTRARMSISILILVFAIFAVFTTSARGNISYLDLQTDTCGMLSSTESVNATLREGQSTARIATGLINGTLTFSNTRLVSIETGAFAGWRWCRVDYTLTGGYSGVAYRIHDGNTRRVYAHVTGDIHAVGRGSELGEKLGRWYVTSINGNPTIGVISHVFDSEINHGTSTKYVDTTLNIYTGMEWSGTSTGFYQTDSFYNTGTSIGIPALAPEGGFNLPTYNLDIGSGNAYSYPDNSTPGLTIIYSSADGPMFGIHTRQWDNSAGCYVGRPASATHEHVIDRGHAPEGNDVTGYVATDDGKRIRVTFSQILAGGTGYVSSQTISSPAPLPDGYTLVGDVYDLDTIANYSGSITVCIDYDESDVSGSESNLKLFHYTGGVWQQLSSSVDSGNNRVCGTTTSLSPFGIGGGGSALPASSSASRVPVFNGWWLLMGIFPGLFLILRRIRRG